MHAFLLCKGVFTAFQKLSLDLCVGKTLLFVTLVEFEEL